MKITFLGGALSVTGSKYLIEEGDEKILIDCGLFQGFKELRERNWAEFPVDPKTIKAVILTHAHLDHSGYLPLLVKNGFNGPIFATPATCALCKVILLDSGHLQEEDAKRANKYGFSKHKPALPLYTVRDAESAIKRFQPIDYYQKKEIDGLLSFTFSRSGHILGSALVTLNSKETEMVFTGDLGRIEDPLMNPPDKIESTDYLLLESTYGARQHPKTDPEKELEAIVNSTLAKGGTTIIAAFAVGRAQTVLYFLSKLKQEGKIPKNLPIYLDSPMGQEATDVFCNIPSENKLSVENREQVCSVARYTKSGKESQALSESDKPCVIIASSGMAEGGRILQHLKSFGPYEKNTIIFTGYQAGGTRGARLLNGEPQIKIFGDMVPIHARIALLSSLSSHADSEELIQWLKNFKKSPKRIFLVHGESEGMEALKQKIALELGWPVEIPEYLSSYDLKV